MVEPEAPIAVEFIAPLDARQQWRLYATGYSYQEAAQVVTELAAGGVLARIASAGKP